MSKMYGLMRLGRDAEIRTTPNGERVANLSLVYNYGRKDAATGERPSQWVDAAFWGERAEAIAPFLSKGSMHLFSLSDVHIEKYTDKNGYEAFKMAGRVDDVSLTPKPKNQETQQGEEPKRRPAQTSGDSTTNAASTAFASATAFGVALPGHSGNARNFSSRQTAQTQQPTQETGSGFYDMDDDIPF